jgi:glycosyltransferase involved in cell wall biosynthesis
VEVVPNPTVFDRFLDLPDRGAARERFGLDPSATVVLALGWWPEVKGVDVLLDAMAILAPRRAELQVLLVGEERMRAFLDERSVSQPPWLRTSRFVSDSAWLFAAADLFVSASRHEGQSSAIGEALACGLAVVMSDIGGTRTWEAAPHVAVFASEDAPALARSVEDLLALKPEARCALGAENREWTRVHAGVEGWCDRLCSIYESVLGGGGLTPLAGSGLTPSAGSGLTPSAGSGLTPSTGAAGEHPSYGQNVLGGQLAQSE